MVDHRASVEDIVNVVEHIRNVDPEQFANIRDEVFEVLKEMDVDFEEICNGSRFRYVIRRYWLC